MAPWLRSFASTLSRGLPTALPSEASAPSGGHPDPVAGPSVVVAGLCLSHDGSVGLRWSLHPPSFLSFQLSCDAE